MKHDEFIEKNIMSIKSKANAWDSLVNYIDKTKVLKEYYEETKTELLKDDCHSHWIMVAKTFDKILHELENAKEDCEYYERHRKS